MYILWIYFSIYVFSIYFTNVILILEMFNFGEEQFYKFFLMNFAIYIPVQELLPTSFVKML